jgi:hypothetical protein
MTEWQHIKEGFWFAIGFFPVYHGLELLAGQIPAWRRMRASKAAKQLRMSPKAKPLSGKAPEDIVNTDIVLNQDIPPNK